MQQPRQLRIHVDLFLYMKYEKRCLQKVCKILPSVHSLTGCESTSSFLGTGKKSVSKLVKTKSSERYEKLALMDGQYKDEVQTTAREFAALLYDPSNKERKYHFSTSCAVNWHCEDATLVESFLPVKMHSNNM